MNFLNEFIPLNHLIFRKQINNFIHIVFLFPEVFTISRSVGWFVSGRINFARELFGDRNIAEPPGSVGF